MQDIITVTTNTASVLHPGLGPHKHLAPAAGLLDVAADMQRLGNLLPRYACSCLTRHHHPHPHWALQLTGSQSQAAACLLS